MPFKMIIKTILLDIALMTSRPRTLVFTFAGMYCLMIFEIISINKTLSAIPETAHKRLVIDVNLLVIELHYFTFHYIKNAFNKIICNRNT